nr:MAG TPA: glutathione-S-transferase, mitochondrial [Caudoviricetes sp.]DAP69703.1 MAG TPA: glutathione-S-transferase, mitochondrial [Caudoviricetes sp.]DAX22020.1 MAG TPA: glutathione-S-transferase, mitochondrial [Caudoviricetes sp.]
MTEGGLTGAYYHDILCPWYLGRLKSRNLKEPCT